MRTIYKYEVGPDVTMPIGAKILTTGEQGGGRIYIWAEVETDAETHVRHFIPLPTGGEIPRGVELTYIGTVHSYSGLVWHVHEVSGV